MAQMHPFPDPAAVIARTIEILGGHDEAWAIIDKEFSSMTHRWNQDVDAIGRILRSHLYVEHYLSEYLEKANPRLGSISQARLTFAQKVNLLDSNNPRLSEILPGIRQLNKIRNRLAHQLTSPITNEDAAVFLQASFFKAMREEGAKPALPSQEPIDILEQFAQHASSWLSNEFSRFSNAFGKALDECKQKSAT